MSQFETLARACMDSVAKEIAALKREREVLDAQHRARVAEMDAAMLRIAEWERRAALAAGGHEPATEATLPDADNANDRPVRNMDEKRLVAGKLRRVAAMPRPPT